ncbi:hypothetical protein DAEQUDRAFT_592584 [Daedalea quercina L-15889]|uniref:Uncharacterized protein n=1 Tax=Daedalea quercina L-15889 TaxID=1314783 RepID=A0A165SWY5_9APHY|nr:hypothetical protein DAEQUDRAFT_592584 [Daedalea quercina L-15889]
MCKCERTGPGLRRGGAAALVRAQREMIAGPEICLLIGVRAGLCEKSAGFGCGLAGRGEEHRARARVGRTRFGRRTAKGGRARVIEWRATEAKRARVRETCEEARGEMSGSPRSWAGSSERPATGDGRRRPGIDSGPPAEHHRESCRRPGDGMQTQTQTQTHTQDSRAIHN